jgi:hypothetical protein
MEYVILAVLIAAATVIAVIVLGRSVATMFITASQSTSGEHTKARDELKWRRGHRNEDAEYAREYHDTMHE